MQIGITQQRIIAGKVVRKGKSNTLCNHDLIMLFFPNGCVIVQNTFSYSLIHTSGPTINEKKPAELISWPFPPIVLPRR
jgi:hypothetical protein